MGRAAGAFATGASDARDTRMRSTWLVAFAAASMLAAAGCGSSGSGGTGGAGGGGGQGGAGGATDCSPPCTGQTVCVGTGVEGGAVFLVGDGGVCPSGRHAQGNICVADLAYACQPLPSGCNGAVNCSCAASLCTTPQTCTVVGANELTCVVLAP